MDSQYIDNPISRRFLGIHDEINQLTGGILNGQPVPKDEVSFGGALLDTLWQLPVGFWEGFTTLDGGNAPKTKAGEIVRGIGNLLGFIGLIPDPTDIAALPAKAAVLYGRKALSKGTIAAAEKVVIASGKKALAKQTDKLSVNALKRIGELESAGDIVRAAEVAAGSRGYGQALGGILGGKSVPLLAASGIMSGAGIAAKAIPSLGRVADGAKALIAGTKYFKNAERMGVLGQMAESATHLGLASGAAQLGINWTQWSERNDQVLQAMGQGALFGGSFALIGNISRVSSKLILEGKPTSASRVLQAFAGSAVQGIPSTLRGDTTTDQVYEYLLGGLFGMQATPWTTQRGMRAYEEAMGVHDASNVAFLDAGDYGRFADNTGIRKVWEQSPDAGRIAYKELLDYYFVDPNVAKKIVDDPNLRFHRLSDEELYRNARGEDFKHKQDNVVSLGEARVRNAEVRKREEDSRRLKDIEEKARINGEAALLQARTGADGVNAQLQQTINAELERASFEARRAEEAARVARAEMMDEAGRTRVDNAAVLTLREILVKGEGSDLGVALLGRLNSEQGTNFTMAEFRKMVSGLDLEYAFSDQPLKKGAAKESASKVFDLIKSAARRIELERMDRELADHEALRKDIYERVLADKLGKETGVAPEQDIWDAEFSGAVEEVNSWRKGWDALGATTAEMAANAPETPRTTREQRAATSGRSHVFTRGWKDNFSNSPLSSAMGARFNGFVDTVRGVAGGAFKKFAEDRGLMLGSKFHERIAVDQFINETIGGMKEVDFNRLVSARAEGSERQPVLAKKLLDKFNEIYGQQLTFRQFKDIITSSSTAQSPYTTPLSVKIETARSRASSFSRLSESTVEIPEQRYNEIASTIRAEREVLQSQTPEAVQSVAELAQVVSEVKPEVVKPTLKERQDARRAERQAKKDAEAEARKADTARKAEERAARRIDASRRAQGRKRTNDKDTGE